MAIGEGQPDEQPGQIAEHPDPARPACRSGRPGVPTGARPGPGPAGRSRPPARPARAGHRRHGQSSSVMNAANAMPTICRGTRTSRKADADAAHSSADHGQGDDQCAQPRVAPPGRPTSRAAPAAPGRMRRPPARAMATASVATPTTTSAPDGPSRSVSGRNVMSTSASRRSGKSTACSTRAMATPSASRWPPRVRSSTTAASSTSPVVRGRSGRTPGGLIAHEDECSRSGLMVHDRRSA